MNYIFLLKRNYDNINNVYQLLNTKKNAFMRYGFHCGIKLISDVQNEQKLWRKNPRKGFININKQVQSCMSELGSRPIVNYFFL